MTDVSQTSTPPEPETAPEATPETALSTQAASAVPVPAVERALPAILQEMLHPEDQKLTYRVTLPAFDGPMELLLHLIKEHEVDIYDIPIAIITKEYLAVLELMQSLNLDVAGDFLVMAATLMQIKSRMLLPADPKGEEGEPEDPRAELVRRLLEYKQFKEAADRLGDLEKDRGRLFPRNVPEDWKESGEEEHLVEVTLFGLLNAFKDVLIHAQKDFSTELVRPEITVTQKINDLMDMLQEQREVLFRPLLLSLKSKLEKIVTFLALLELVRLKLVKAYQAGPFDEIRLFLAENSPSAAEAPNRVGRMDPAERGEELVLDDATAESELTEETPSKDKDASTGEKEGRARGGKGKRRGKKRGKKATEGKDEGPSPEATPEEGQPTSEEVSDGAEDQG